MSRVGDGRRRFRAGFFLGGLAGNLSLRASQIPAYAGITVQVPGMPDKLNHQLETMPEAESKGCARLRFAV